MLRKLFSSIILVIFLTNSMNNAFAVFVEASVPSMDYQISSSKERIKKMQNGQRYIIQLNKINQFVNKQSDLLLLEKIKLKLESKKELISWKDELTYELLNYIDLVVAKRIEELEIIESADVIKQIEKTTLTDEEIKKVEDEIVKLQINLLDSSKTFADKLLSELKKSLNAEEVGNIKINVEGSGAMLWSWKWELSIKDYKSKAANFDSELEAQVDLLFEASMAGWQDMKAQFSSFVNFISKDGNMYLLLEKLNYSWLDELDYSWEYTSILDKIKAMWENNEYLKIEDKEWAKMLNLIKSFDVNSVYNEANKALLNPMLKPYKKDWDKYLLVPTKDFCNTVKYINYKINHYGSYSCSDEDYNKMLKESVIGGNLYIIVDWADKHLWFESNQYWVDAYFKVYFSDKKVEKVLAKSETTTWKDKGNLIELTYINWQKLDITVLSQNINENINLSFKSLLTSDNKFSQIDHIWNFSDRWEWFKSSFKLDNKKFNGNFTLVWNKEINLIWNISWELSNENNLKSLDLKVNANWDKNKYNYDWETWKSSSTSVKTSFNLNYSLKNEVITWAISYKEDDNVLFWVNSNWKYSKDFFELNNVINIDDDVSAENVNWNLNVKFVWNLEKNNFNLYLDFYSNKGYFKFNITSDSVLEYKEGIKIEAPTKYKNIEDLMNNASKGIQDAPASEAPEFFE